jgi:two-component system alkaline phosphatase synthesis response regulator PhoP
LLSAANTGGLDNDAEIQLGQLRIFPAQFQASYAGVPLELTNLEFRLLTLFSRNPGRVLNRERISQQVWGGRARGRTIDIHVSRLRRHLPPETIQTVVKVGYRMVLEE